MPEENLTGRAEELTRQALKGIHTNQKDKEKHGPKIGSGKR